MNWFKEIKWRKKWRKLFPHLNVTFSKGFRHDAYSATDVYTFEQLRKNLQIRTGYYISKNEIRKTADPRLFHWNGSVAYSGYMREASLLYLTKYFQPGDENRILLRLSDWVPQVRSISIEWVRSNFEELPFSSISENHRVILMLERKPEFSDAPWLKDMRQIMLNKANDTSLAEFMQCHPSFRRYLYRLSLDSEQHLRKWILEDPDPNNRLTLLIHPKCEDLTSHEINALNKDKSMNVRRAAIHRRVRMGDQLSQEECVKLALDPRRSLRRIGQFYLQEDYHLDASTLYRACDDDKKYYVSDYKNDADLDVFLEGINQATRKDIRETCLRAVVTVDPASLKTLDVDKLLKKNASFRHILIPHLVDIRTLEEIRDMKPFFEELGSGGLCSYYWMVYKKSYWDFVYEALQEFLDRDISRQINGHLKKLIQSKQIHHIPIEDNLRTDIQILLERLRSQGSSLDPWFIRNIEFCIK